MSVRSVSRALTIGAALVSSASLLAVAPDADAQTFGYNDRRRFETPQNFALELRGGPYWPAVDSEFSSGHPFLDIFGAPPSFNTPSARVFGALSFEWQAVRIGPVASLGVGVSAGFTTISEAAPFTASMTGAASTWTRSTEQTALSIIPGTLHLVARFDGLARHVPYLPISPYVKAGLGYGIWWVTNGQGTVHVTNTQDAVGGSLGWYAALGASFLLDVLEPRVAQGLDQQEGINHTWIFFEYYLLDLAGFGGRSQLNVGNASTAGGPNGAVGSWVLGMMLEF